MTQLYTPHNPDKITTHSAYTDTQPFTLTKQWKREVDTYYTYNTHKPNDRHTVEKQLRAQLDRQYSTTRKQYTAQYRDAQNALYQQYIDAGMQPVLFNNGDAEQTAADTLSDTVQSPVQYKRNSGIDATQHSTHAPGIVYQPTLVYYMQTAVQQHKPNKSILHDMIHSESSVDLQPPEPTADALQPIHNTDSLSATLGRSQPTLKQRQTQQIVEHTQRMHNTRILSEIKQNREFANTVNKSIQRNKFNETLQLAGAATVTQEHLNIITQSIYELNATAHEIKNNLNIVTNKKQKMLCIEQLLQCQVKLDSLAVELVRAKKLFKQQQLVQQQLNSTCDAEIQVDVNDIQTELLPTYNNQSSDSDETNTLVPDDGGA